MNLFFTLTQMSSGPKLPVVTLLTLSRRNYFIRAQRPTFVKPFNWSPFSSKKVYLSWIRSFLLFQSYAPFPGLNSTLPFYLSLSTYKLVWDSLTLQITSCSPTAYAWDCSISVFILTLFEKIASTPFHCQPLEIWILPPFKLKSLSQMPTLTINVKCKGPFSTSSPSFEDTTTCLLPISHYFPKFFAISYCTLMYAFPKVPSWYSPSIILTLFRFQPQLLHLWW